MLKTLIFFSIHFIPFYSSHPLSSSTLHPNMVSRIIPTEIFSFIILTKKVKSNNYGLVRILFLNSHNIKLWIKIRCPQLHVEDIFQGSNSMIFVKNQNFERKILNMSLTRSCGHSISFHNFRLYEK